MTHGSLFSGIGGFDLAARWMGWRNVFHVERDPFCRQVLAHHFPESLSFDDVKNFDATDFRGRVSVISGGFPCQPFSAAGKRAGTADDRYLWPEMFRIICEARPSYVVAENVRGLTSWNGGLVLDKVCADLEGEGYEVVPTVLPAASVNAPHRRDRIWIIAYADNYRTGKPVRVEPGYEACDRQGATQLERRTHGGDGTASNTDGNGPLQLGPDERSPQGARPEAAEWGINRQPATDGHTHHAQPAPDTNCPGCKERKLPTEPTGPDKFSRVIDARPAADGDGTMRQHRHGQGAPSWSTIPQDGVESPDGPRSWEAFPSVAPVCGGDDGLPAALDGITVSKWRRESIKAYGNAIVPQVAYQIFQALVAVEQK